MKKIIKTNLNIIVAILIAVIVSSGITGVAAYTLLSNHIEYEPADSAWKVSNVEEALDSLYIAKTGNNYSTEERVVGTWIDGKPVYQKTIIGNFETGRVGSSWGNITLVPNIDTIVYIVGYYNDYHSTCDIAEVGILNAAEGTVEIVTANGRTLTAITVQYTKTEQTQTNEG